MKLSLCRLSRLIVPIAVIYIVSLPLAAEDVPNAELTAVESPATAMASAAEAAPAAEPKPSAERESKFSREWLESRGIAFTAGYRAEVFGNLRGGVDRKFGSNFLGSADFAMELDLSKMRAGRGHVVLSVQSLHGRGITERKIGTVQAVSNLEESPFSKVVEAYYSDRYLGGKIIFKVGRQYADADFNVAENAGDFLNSSYGLIRTVLMPTFPAPQAGGSVWVSPKSWLSFGTGVFRGDMLEPIAEAGASTRKGVFTLAEVKVSPYTSGSRLHGTYHFGVWRQGNSSYALDATASNRPISNYGFYVTGDQWFRQQNSAGVNIGPGAFFQVGWSPSDRNELHRYAGGGIAWPGLIPQRRWDSIGIGVTAGWIRGARHADTVTELFYKLRVNSKITIQPDLQYARKPGGTGANALLGGLRLGLEF